MSVMSLFCKVTIVECNIYIKMFFISNILERSMLVNSMQTNKSNMQYWTDDTPTEALTNMDSVYNKISAELSLFSLLFSWWANKTFDLNMHIWSHWDFQYNVKVCSHCTFALYFNHNFQLALILRQKVLLNYMILTSKNP